MFVAFVLVSSVMSFCLKLRCCKLSSQRPLLRGFSSAFIVPLFRLSTHCDALSSQPRLLIAFVSAFVIASFAPSLVASFHLRNSCDLFSPQPPFLLAFTSVSAVSSLCLSLCCCVRLCQTLLLRTFISSLVLTCFLLKSRFLRLRQPLC